SPLDQLRPSLQSVVPHSPPVESWRDSSCPPEFWRKHCEPTARCLWMPSTPIALCNDAQVHVRLARHPIEAEAPLAAVPEVAETPIMLRPQRGGERHAVAAGGAERTEAQPFP